MSKIPPLGFMVVHKINLSYITEKCKNKIPVNKLDNDMYVDPITCQTFEQANQINHGNNPQNGITLEPDTNQKGFNSRAY